MEKESLQEKGIDPLNCDLWWLAGYTLPEWKKLPLVEKQKHWNKWEFWKREEQLLKLRQEAAAQSGPANDLLRDLRDEEYREDCEIFRSHYRSE